VQLEKEIFQNKPFESNIHRSVVNIMYTMGWMMNEEKVFFGKFGITSKQFNILRILRGSKDPISTSVIRDRMIDKLSDVSRIVSRLEKKGLLIKKINPADQRKVNITLNKKAIRLLSKIDKELNPWLSQLSGLSEKEAKQLSNLLDKFRS